MATKAELEAKIASLEEHIIAQAKELEELRFIRAIQVGPTCHTDTHNRRWIRTAVEGRPVYVLPKATVSAPVQRELPMFMRKAREEAMRTGRAVRAG